MKIMKYLKTLADIEYKSFHSKLMPTVAPNKILGIRTPVLRKFAKEFSKSSEAADFLNTLPHEYYEENNLHGMLIERLKDYNEVICRLDAFLPFIDNWATCDLISPKIFKKHTDELYFKIVEWISCDHTYTARHGIKTLMTFYLDEHFQKEHLELVTNKRSQEYYANMATAWYFATALAKQYESTLPYLENRRLDIWTHNKAIQKAIESYRVTNEQKNYLRKLKIK